MFKKILIATDFSQCAEQLWECLGELRELGAHELVAAHVTPLSGAGRFKEYAEKKLAERRAAVENAGYQYDTVVRYGPVAQEVLDIAEERKVDLVVIGAKGENLFRRVFLGNTAWDLVRMGNVPTLVEKFKLTENEKTCQPVCTRKFVKVLLPVDFSAFSLQVARKLKPFLAGYGSAAVLLHVVDRGSDEKDVEKIKQEATEQLRELQKEMKEAGLETEIRIRVGIPSEHIIKTAEDDNATLIAMATRGAGNIKELLLGSTAENVVQRANCPVLLFPYRL